MALKIYLSPSSQVSNPYSAQGTNEQRQCNRIAEAAKAALERNGYEVKKAPEGQGYVQNVAESNAWGANIHMPIHTNAGGSAKGTMGLCYQGCATNKYMQAVYNAVAELTPWADSGIIVRNDLYEINSTSAMCVYMEMAFHDKMDSAQWIIDNVVPLGEAIAKGMCAADGKTYIAGDGTEVVPPMNSSGSGSGSSAGLQELGPVDAEYMAYAAGKWWPPVKNRDDWAGKGDGTPIQAFALKVSKGYVEYRAHSMVNGWLGWVTGYDINDYNNGFAGDYTDIDMIQVYYYTPEGYIYKEAVYRVSDLNNIIYYPVQRDTKEAPGYDGYAGVPGTAIDKLQIWIE